MSDLKLTDRERDVLMAVIESYVRTARPTGSRVVARDYGLEVSPATVRNTMADLEAKGLLTQPHPSAGRLPTDLAYRFYVDALMARRAVTPGEREKIRKELQSGEIGAIEDLVGRAARVLSLLTGELGLAVGPALAAAALQRVEFVPVDSEKALLVLTLESGVVRTVYVDLPTELPPASLSAVARALNERLAGSTLAEIQATLSERLRDLPLEDPAARELANIFVGSGPDIFEWVVDGRDVHLGSASALAEQPEFTSGERLRSLIQLTERRELLASVLGERLAAAEPQVTIGAEHRTPQLSELTIVTAAYSVGALHGVVGVIGPTRMAYDKVVSLVDTTSSLVSSLARR